MPLFFCTKCDIEFEAKAGMWGKAAPCPTCKNNFKTIDWSVAKRTARTNRIANSVHPLVRYDPVLKQALSYLDEKGLGLSMLVCSRWHVAAQSLFTSYVPRMIAYGSMSHKLKDVLIAPNTGLLTTVRNLQLAVDQFPFPSFKDKKTSVLNYIITNNISIDLSLGTDDERTRKALVKAAQSVTLIKGFAKMHNKIWVLDHEGVILGSPNVSYSGLEGRNIESFILIRSARLGSMFTKYLKMLKAPTDTIYEKLSREVFDELTVYNKQSHRLKVAMAPLINITDFVAEQLEGAVKIVVRQFLVSHKHEYDESESLDIVDVLCGMARKGVEIEIVLDQSAYESQDFVRRAAWDLGSAGCKVFLQQPVLIVDTDSECLMHDKLILATLRKGVKRTLMGSAGFTSNVIANQNAECFISTDLDSVFDTMLIHSDKAMKTQKTTKLVFKK